LLDKALVEASVALPLEKARRLATSAKDELEIVIRDFFVPKDVQRLAIKWEPQRKLDAELKDSLRHDLIDLLHGRRPHYTGFALVALEEARRDVPRYREYITRSLPTNDAKKLLKAWDKKLRPMPTTRELLVRHLLKLLHGDGPDAVVPKRVA
jgi:hypothetical protein